MKNNRTVIIILLAIIAIAAIYYAYDTYEKNKEKDSKVTAIKDKVKEDLINILAHAQQYYKKPANLGGGGHSFNGFEIPTTLDYSSIASFNINEQNDNKIVIQAEFISLDAGGIPPIKMIGTADSNGDINIQDID